VVITQEACEVCAISYGQVSDALRGAPGTRLVALAPSRLDDIFGDVRRVAEACRVPHRGAEVADALVARVRQAARAHAPRPRVAVVEWLAPPMLAGHWVPEAIEAAGGTAVGPRPGEPSPYTTWEEVRALAPDAVIVAPCGFDLDRTRRECGPWTQALRGLAPRILLLDGNAFLNRPGPRIVDAIEAVAGWLARGFVGRGTGEDLGTVLAYGPLGDPPETDAGNAPEGR
jgi:iron complex transport system substrate-binding protein